ncbi:hypothetical protein [Nocardioides sp.]|uniref:hypothetical protein n=1 Tax=Nocardioides sp. TaxID=35761 RepID=UPI0039E24017
MRRQSETGERLLATAVGAEGEVAGSREALHLPGHRIPWEQVETASWSAEDGVLTVVEAGTWGSPRPVHRVALDRPGRLLELVRERVTATVLLQRAFAGGRVVARRAPAGNREVAWFLQYDDAVDPADPAVAEAADAALLAARAEVGW